MFCYSNYLSSISHIITEAIAYRNKPGVYTRDLGGVFRIGSRDVGVLPAVKLGMHLASSLEVLL